MPVEDLKGSTVTARECAMGVNLFFAAAYELKIGVILVGAAFQPRLINKSFRATSFRGWKATPTSNWFEFKMLGEVKNAKNWNIN